MELKPVKIRIVSVAKEPGVQPIEQVFKGQMTEKQGKFYAFYQDKEETGFGGTKVTIKWEEDRVLILRSGALVHRQEFYKDMVDESTYQSPYMEIPLVTTTHYVFAYFRKGIWHLDVEYTLAHGGQPYGEMKLVIEIEEEK